MKKTLSLILAVVMSIPALVGCTQEQTSTTPPSTDGSTIATTPSTAAPTTEPTTESTIQPTTEPTTEPTTKPTTEPTTESTTEPTEPPHTHSYATKVIAPTCESKGYTEYTCACGDSYKSNETKATGHSYTSKTVEATCGSDGYTKHTCSKCGTSYTDNKTSATGKHSYTTKTVAPTATEDGYDLHTCGVCGKSYKDNYTPKTGNSGGNNSGEGAPGMYWDDREGKWLAHNCATDGHVFTAYAVVQEQTCYQYEIKEAPCGVIGCDYVYRLEGNSYDAHTRSVDDITGYYVEYKVRRYDGYSAFFTNEAEARAYANTVVTAYKNGECQWWLEYIQCIKRINAPDQYTCLVCGKTCSQQASGGKYNGETENGIVWEERYDRDNQPSF